MEVKQHDMVYATAIVTSAGNNYWTSSALGKSGSRENHGLAYYSQSSPRLGIYYLCDFWSKNTGTIISL